MPIVFWFSRLQPGVSAEDYERWVRDVDYKYAEQLPSLLSYRVCRAHGAAVGDEKMPYDYVEIAEITDLEAYRRDIAEHPAAQAIIAEIGNYIEGVGNIFTMPIENESSK